MSWVPTRFLTHRRQTTLTGRSMRASRNPLSAPRRQQPRATPAWSRRAAAERRPLRRVGCLPKRW